MNDVPTKKVNTYTKTTVRSYGSIRDKWFPTTLTEVDIQELFRHDPVGLEIYKECMRGIDARLTTLLRR